MRHALRVLPILLLGAGCITINNVPNGVPDARKNLIGDKTRTYMDIVEASVQAEGADFSFSVKTASRMPAPRDFTGGKRVDFIWFVDADRNTTTGQGKEGNDYNLHLFMDETGWHTSVHPVSDLAKGFGKVPNLDECRYRVDGTTLTLLVPQHTFPDAFFDWWAYAMTDNAPAWKPRTENAYTKRASTRSKV